MIGVHRLHKLRWTDLRSGDHPYRPASGRGLERIVTAHLQTHLSMYTICGSIVIATELLWTMDNHDSIITPAL